MSKRTRTNQVNVYLSDDELHLLLEKTKISGAKSYSAFIRNLIIYGFTYDVDYKDLHEYSVALSRINNSLNQIAKRKHQS